jgi:hypothetical protein
VISNHPLLILKLVSTHSFSSQHVLVLIFVYFSLKSKISAADDIKIVLVLLYTKTRPIQIYTLDILPFEGNYNRQSGFFEKICNLEKNNSAKVVYGITHVIVKARRITANRFSAKV